MIIVIGTSIIAIFLTYLSGQPKYSKLKLFQLSFILITLIACIHYNYGNDYMTYYYDFQRISHNPAIFQLIKNGYYNEPGWVLMNWIFQKPNGFFALVAIISIVENYIYYIFIRNYVEPKRRWISVSIYLLQTSFYVLNFSMLRQGFTIALCVAAGMLAGKKKWIPAAIIVLVASTIHLSAIVFLPFVFIGLLPLQKGKIYAIVYFCTTVILFLFDNSAVRILAVLTDSVTSLGGYVDYTSTIGGWGNTLGIGFLLGAVVYVVFFHFIFTSFNLPDENFEMKYFVVLSCVAFCVIPFQIVVSGLAGRVGMYFSAFHFVTVPYTYKRIKNKILRLGVSSIYVLMLFVGYYNFFFNSWATNYYSEFHTIFGPLFNW